MNPLILGPILDIGKTLIDRFGPEDQTAKAQAQAELVKMAADGELKTVIAQLEINAKEASNPSVFVAGWRPFFGWIGGIGFLYAVMIQPLLSWYSAAHGMAAAPELDASLLMTVVTGLLGIGGLRTYEKKTGVAK